MGKLAFFFLAALPAQAGETLEAAVDRLVHAHRASVVGMSVGVAHGDTVLLKGYGRVEHDRDVKPNADSVYEIGSISKVFTGVLLAILVGDGVVRLDQPVQDLLPDSVTVPAFDGRRITLLDLTTHTAALPRMPTNFAPRDFTNPYADYSVERMYAFVSAWKLPYAPGTKYLYSNLGAGFLGHALARRAKKSYEDLLVARIAEPLGMKSTRITLTDEMRRRLAAPHDGSLRPGHMWDIPTLAGAGGIRSTARDMLVFLRSNLSAKHALAEPLAVARKVHFTGPPGIGFGWHIGRHGSRWHNGQTGGYHAFAAIDTSSKRAVVILSNTANDVPDLLGRQVLALPAGKK
ncbi:MAG: serine hydrolase domain-containing protein [Planctomycetota bacterium]